MLLGSLIGIAILITDGAWQGLGAVILFLPFGLLGMYWFTTPKPAMVIDGVGIRSEAIGWDVHWDDVTEAVFERRWLYSGWIFLKTLVFYVDDPGAVVRRLPAKRRRGKRARRVRRALRTNGVRFALHFLDTPVEDVVAAVERYVPVERD